MANETIKKTLTVATLLCIVCSVLVSTSAVGLKGLQDANKARDRNKNILKAAGLWNKGDPERSVPAIFQEKVEPRVVDLDTGDFDDAIDPADFDQRKSARNPATSEVIPDQEDLADIKRRSKKAIVYLVKEGGAIGQIILPVHGKGLWSTMYGFLALDKDTTTVRGITFYEHGETPGLGGEIENELWQAKWIGRKVFDASWDVDIEVIKGSADRSAEHKVDGLSGATISSRGVTHLLHYWLGQNGFGPFLAKLRSAR